MTTNEALDFLRQHQPMPADDKLSQDLIDRYDEVRKFFLSKKDARCVPLFLNSFGYIDGHGVYQLVEDVITQFSPEEVVPHLEIALHNPEYSVRYWCAQIASVFPSDKLLPKLQLILEFDDFDLKYAALTALEQFEKYQSKPIIEGFLQKESDEELIDLAKNILS